MPIVVGVFENVANAEDAVADLVASGYARSDISVLVRTRDTRYGRDSHRGPTALAPSAGVTSIASPPKGRSADGLPSALNAGTEEALATTLKTAGLQPAAALFFADAICNGAVLVAVHCTAPRARDARDILDVYNDSPGGAPIAQRYTLM